MEAQCSICMRVAAKLSCSCAFPSVLICAGCAGVHLETEGLHITTPLNKKVAAPAQVQGNQVCDICGTKAAIRLCLCTTPVRKYCEDCDFAHYRKAPLLNHSEHPISTYAAVTSNRILLEVFHKKQLFLNAFQLRLTQELVNFDAFVSQVGEKFDQLIALATTKKEALLRDLQVNRGKLARLLNSAKQEIEAKRYAEAFEVKTYLDGVILNGYMASSMPEVRMFEGKVDVEISELLEKAVTYGIVGDIELALELQREIPVIKGNNLRLFHRLTLQMTQKTLNHSTQINDRTAYCFINANVLLCCSGKTLSRAYEINVRTGNVERVASMGANRGYAGIWKYRNGFVYIFGGLNSNFALNSAEKYSLTSKTWQLLRDTLHTAKYLCSVCEHSAKLYISGLYCPNTGSSIDCFNPENETFSLLRSDNIAYASILCCEGNSLYCVRSTTIEEANLSNGPAAATFVTKANIPVLGRHYWLSCPMPWLAGELTSVLNCGGNIGGLFRFSPAKSQFTEVAPFTY